VNRRVSFRSEAEAEVLETRDWYEGRRPGLGAEFRAALDEAIERLADNPMQFRLVRGETRRAILNRFPYAVYFRAIDKEIVILAIHGRQQPRQWKSRQESPHLAQCALVNG
jgi:plasmid stabilization system protein ParE